MCILGISESELGQLGRECIHIYRENGFEKELRESRNYILLILINPNTPLEVSRIHSIVEAGLCEDLPTP